MTEIFIFTVRREGNLDDGQSIIALAKTKEAAEKRVKEMYPGHIVKPKEQATND